jgi:Mrp family chromosome partitioning ATPase
VNISGNFQGLSGAMPLSSHILNGGAAAHTIDAVNSPTIFGFNSRDRRSRPFNLLRAQVVKIMRAQKWEIIGVTSATPRVGKSFMATNLAASLSRLPGTRTLLFDFDLRRGSIAEMYGIPPGPGINTYLNGEIDSLEAIAYDVPGTGLTIYPSFPTGESSAELLAGDRMRALVQAMRELPENFLCICDLPPAFANDDASIVLQVIDAYLFIVEEGMTTENHVRDAIDLLQPSPCIGTVLNRYNGGIGGGNYGFGYGTQSYYDAYYL